MDERATPDMIAAAWKAFRAGRPGHLVSPGPGFVEAINAALATRPVPEAAPVQATPEMRRLLNTAREALAGGRYGKAERAIESLQDVFDRAPSQKAGDGWMPASTVPEGVKVRLRSLKFGWYATGMLVRYSEDGEGGRFSNTSWDLLHYNDWVYFTGFRGTGDMEWSPLPAPPATPTDGDVA